MKLDVGALVRGARAREDSKLGGRLRQRPASPQRIIHSHPRALYQRGIDFVERFDAVDLVDCALLLMVLQIASDALTVENGVDAARLQPFVRPDAGAM